jgi:hypothetical protein
VLVDMLVMLLAVVAVDRVLLDQAGHLVAMVVAAELLLHTQTSLLHKLQTTVLNAKETQLFLLRKTAL